MYKLWLGIAGAMSVCLFSYALPFALAEEITSDNFKITTPTLAPGMYSTSTSYSLISTLGQFAAGLSESTTLYIDRAGFAAFPFATTPAVSATAGDAQVALSWNASTGYVGWTASAYE